ncbi:MAG: hypothetical protein CMI81_01410 [Candidatus Pelagibacter sp.]|nr:hypothetical protein [Candidatus Pelagibacter sp.]OUV98140.1 MAG: hypothetical protein CBD02_01950 [Candidatus Pelagibacter sp. TMED142]
MFITDRWLSKVLKLNAYHSNNIILPVKIKKKKRVFITIKDKKFFKNTKKSKFKFIGKNIILKKKIFKEKNLINNKIKFLIVSRKYKQKIIKLCIKNMSHSRFDLDKRLSKYQIRKIRTAWIAEYFKKKKLKNTHIMLLNNKLIGFVFLKIKKKNAIIDLICIDKKYSGSGFGKYLILYLQTYYNKFKNIIVGTYTKNKKALNFYKSSKFKTIYTYNVYHYYAK